MRERLTEIWDSLVVPAVRTELAGKRFAGLDEPRIALIAVDGAGKRHLLVRTSENQPLVVSRETRGLQVTTERLRVEDNPEHLFIDLVCLDPSHDRLFATLGEDLFESLKRSTEPESEVVLRTLTRWRAFWTVKAGTLTLEEALGLFGELWFLYQWLGSVAIPNWIATPAARHDFQWPDASIEVKTAMSGSIASAVHRINGLDQLDDPVTGQLYLFSLLVIEDVLSSHTLDWLVTRISEELDPQQNLLAMFRERLAAVGYVPGESMHYQKKLRIVREGLYAIRSDFPKLTRHSFPNALPAGIERVQYSLVLSACEPWKVATLPSDRDAQFLHER